jgi:hypothetical protein
MNRTPDWFLAFSEALPLESHAADFFGQVYPSHIWLVYTNVIRHHSRANDQMTPLPCTLGLDEHRVERLARRHEQPAPFGSAETQVGNPHILGPL